MKIIIPAYDPDEKLISLIHNIQSNCGYDIVIVNDGSSVTSNEIFQKASDLNCKVLVHNNNKGKGAALKTAFTYLLKIKEEDGFVCADCDGQHTWQDIKKLADEIPLHGDSVLLGCREFIGEIPMRSLIGNKITCFIYSLISNNKLSDTQTGLRGFSAHMLPWLISLQGNRYEYEMNQLLEAKSAGYQLYSISIQTIYENSNVGSHFHPVRDSIKIYLPILKFIISSLSCGIIDFIALFVINSLSHNLLLSVVLARVFSSLCNYYINKMVVFQAEHQKHYTSLVKYYALVIFILIGNYIMIDFFVNTAGISLLFSKIITECILFIISYFIQHRFVFK